MLKRFLPLLSKKYLKNNLLLVVFVGLGKIFSFIWKSLLLRESIELVGEIEVLFTTLGLMTAFSVLALPAAFSRFSLKNRKKTIPYKNLALKKSGIIYVLLISIIFLISAAFQNFYQKIFIVPVITFIILLISNLLQEFYLAFLNIEKKFATYGLFKFVFQPGIRFILLFLILLGLISKKFIFDHVIVSIVFPIILLSIVLIGTKFFRRQKSALSKKEVSRFMSYTTALSGSFVSFIAFGTIDIYLIQYFTGNYYVGIYSAIFMIINILDLLFAPFLQTFQVHLADRKEVKNKEKFAKKTIIGLFISGSAVGLIITTLLPTFSSRFLGIENISTLMILFFVIAKIMHSSLVLISRHYLDFEGEEKFTFKTMNISLILKVILGIILIPKVGLMGAAISQIIVEIVHLWLLKNKARFLTKLSLKEFFQPFSAKNY